MHELSLVQSILQKTLEVAEAHGGLPVEKVQVRIGRLRQVVPELLSWSFDVLKKDTLAKDAAIEWEEVAPLVRCDNCSETFEPDDVFWICPACDAAGGEALKGEELTLESISLEEPDGN